MLTSLDGDESQNFFSRKRIKLLEVEYREVTLGHTQCASLHAVNDAKSLIARPWVTGWAPWERRQQLPLKSRVVGGLHRHCLFDALSVFSKQC